MTKRFGFTLAEVLITLGIIGVVAAMTIPVLIQDYNERVWNTGADVFNKNLENALKTMNTQQTLAGHTTTESFVEELSKHFKTNKICQNDELLDCFSETVYWSSDEGANSKEVDMSKIKLAKDFGINDWNTNIVGVQFANGTNSMIAYNPKCEQNPFSNEIPVLNCLAFLYDTSGDKSPNSKGKDLRGVNINRLDGRCNFYLGNTCFSTPFWPTPMSIADCEAQKESLGISSCIVENDRWVGAVAACGGVENMPSMDQLSELVKYLYGLNISGNRVYCPYDSDNNRTICRDYEKAKALGFTVANKNADFFVWAKSSGASNIINHMDYYSTNALKSGSYRTHPNVQAVCILD